MIARSNSCPGKEADHVPGYTTVDFRKGQIAPRIECPPLSRHPRRRDGQRRRWPPKASAFNERIYTPLVTLCMFLSQVLDPDHSCRAAVARLIVWLAINGRKPCSPETNSYCDARQRLPLGVIVRLGPSDRSRDRGRRHDQWLWKGRGPRWSTAPPSRCPTPRRTSKPSRSRRPRRSAWDSRWPGWSRSSRLATGVVRDLALGPYKGKETGETALFRTLLDGLEAGEIVLGDRYFASYFGIAELSRAGRRRSVPDAPAAEVRLPPAADGWASKITS